jgi:hypothetical protein
MQRERDGKSGRSRFLILLLGTVLLQLNGACMAESLPAEELESEVGEVSQAGMGPQGMGPQGQGAQGMGPQGQGAQGAFSGATFNGKIPSGYQLGKARVSSGGQWYFPQATAIVSTSTLATIAPTAASPFYLTGVVRPGAGVTFSGISGDTVNLRLTTYRSADTTTNLFAVPPANPFAPTSSQSNSDVTLYKVEWQTGPSTWASVCPLGGEGVAGSTTASGTGWAVFIRGTYDATAKASELQTTTTVPGAGAELTIACTNGVISKCARQWGYKPWKSAPNHINGYKTDLRPFHQMCLRAARADYCADGSSFTVDGTIIDMADSRGLVIREPEQSTTALLSGESSFSIDLGGGSPEGRNYCLGHTRYDEITATTTCSGLGQQAPSSCDANYGNSDYTRDPSNITFDHIWVGSKDSCPHTTSQTGAKMAPDCNYCTRRICNPGDNGYAPGTRGGAIPPSSTAGDDYCCTNGWDAQCVSEAAAWCTPSVWSSYAEFSSYETGTLEADWYALAGPNGENRYDFTQQPKDHGPLGTAPFGTPSGFPSNSGARWLGSSPSSQATGYFRYRFRGWKTAQVTLWLAANSTFEVYADGIWVGAGATPGIAYAYPLDISQGKEHLIAVKVDKPGGGNAFALDIR